MNISINSFVRPALILAGAFLLSGCEHTDMSDLENYVAEVKSRQKSDIEPLPEIKQAETFVFNSEGVRDPFSPSDNAEIDSEKLVSNGIRPDDNRRKEELESYSLDSLRMVGTLEMKTALKGLIRANDGKIYSVSPGNYMGQNHGRILRINSKKMELVELIPDGSGGWQERQAALAITN